MLSYVVARTYQCKARNDLEFGGMKFRGPSAAVRCDWGSLLAVLARRDHFELIRRDAMHDAFSYGPTTLVAPSLGSPVTVDVRRDHLCVILRLS